MRALAIILIVMLGGQFLFIYIESKWNIKSPKKFSDDVYIGQWILVIVLIAFSTFSILKRKKKTTN